MVKTNKKKLFKNKKPKRKQTKKTYTNKNTNKSGINITINSHNRRNTQQKAPNKIPNQTQAPIYIPQSSQAPIIITHQQPNYPPPYNNNNNPQSNFNAEAIENFKNEQRAYYEDLQNRFNLLNSNQDTTPLQTVDLDMFEPRFNNITNRFNTIDNEIKNINTNNTNQFKSLSDGIKNNTNQFNTLSDGIKNNTNQFNTLSEGIKNNTNQFNTLSGRIEKTNNELKAIDDKFTKSLSDKTTLMGNLNKKIENTNLEIQGAFNDPKNVNYIKLNSTFQELANANNTKMQNSIKSEINEQTKQLKEFDKKIKNVQNKVDDIDTNIAVKDVINNVVNRIEGNMSLLNRNDNLTLFNTNDNQKKSEAEKELENNNKIDDTVTFENIYNNKEDLEGVNNNKIVRPPDPVIAETLINNPKDDKANKPPPKEEFIIKNTFKSEDGKIVYFSITRSGTGGSPAEYNANRPEFLRSDMFDIDKMAEENKNIKKGLKNVVSPSNLKLDHFKPGALDKIYEHYGVKGKGSKPPDFTHFKKHFRAFRADYNRIMAYPDLIDFIEEKGKEKA